MSSIDVLIVGAGPSGLMMGTALSRYGLKVRIIDKASEPSQQSKAIAIQARTLEIFDHLNIVQPFLEKGLPLQATNLFSRKKRIAHIYFKQLESLYPFVLTLEQSKTEKILADALTSTGIFIEREVDLIHFDQNKDHIHAVVKHRKTDREEDIQTSWMVGCDGAHSLIRKNLGLSFQGKIFADIFSLADVHLDWKYPHNELFIFLDSFGVMAVFPLPDPNRYRLIFQLKRCRDLLKETSLKEHGLIHSKIIADPTLEETQELLDKYVEGHLKDPIWMANFHINSRLSDHYRKDRVFLVGDAAHIHSPVGGQGMNTGMQDAFNLAWKLVYVMQNKASHSLLNSYTSERHAVGKTLLKATERASFFATLHNPVLIFFRNIILSWLFKKPGVQKKLIRAISEISIQYDKSFTTLFQKSPKIGQRAPNAPFQLNGTDTDFFSLWRQTTNYRLLVFMGFHCIETLLRSLQNNLKTQLKDPSLQVIFITNKPVNIDSKIQVLDKSGKAHQIYRARKGALFMIRPDGYICNRQSLKTYKVEKFFSTL